jgi:hypothetical protein
MSLFFKRSIENLIKKQFRKICNIRFDASSSALSNDENRCSLSDFYEELFKKYSSVFFEMSVGVTVAQANETYIIKILLLLY